MDQTYTQYCLADRYFYDSPANVEAEGMEFAVARRELPAGASRSTVDSWLVCRPAGVELPQQGWKIHVSACLDNAERVLDVVWDYCFSRGVAFKFLSGYHILQMHNSKYAHRGSSGKLVTIYPTTEDELELVLNELGAELEGEPGPYILSDLRWGNGPLYVRYGGFAKRQCLSGTGEMVPAIADDTGKLVPDERGPVFATPSWVALPDFLAPHLAARGKVTVDDLPYRVEDVLHFSNGGGLYVARDRETGEKVVLKEARPHAGLSADGRDAVTRLQRERDIMEQLRDVAAVPTVQGYFAAGEHHFLAQQFFEGQPLNKTFSQRHPFVGTENDDATLADYTSWALDVYHRVERAMDEIHERGIVFGDLHPFNIMLRPDGEVGLIDFEVASRVEEGARPKLANPGFLAPPDREGVEIDRYALACLRLSLFLPLTSLLRLDAHKAEQLAGEIAESFPVPHAFLDEAVRVIVGAGRELGSSPRRQYEQIARAPDEPAAWPSVRGYLADAILASATPHRDDRLFPGDIAQFDTGGLDIAYGAAGVLYALSVTGAGRHPEHEEWLVRRAGVPDRASRLGFYDGLHGVAFVLDHLGYPDQALKLLDLCLSEQWDRLGLDLLGGLSGIGLNLAHFADTTGDASLHQAALKVAQVVADRLGDEDDVATVSGGGNPTAGLIRGSSGPALLFTRLYERTGDTAFLDLAATGLGQDLRRCFVRDSGALHVDEGWRTLPYLADGSAGIGLVLDDYLAHRPDGRFAAARAGIRKAARSPFYIQPGLFSGRAGILAYLSHTHDFATAMEEPAVADQTRRLATHALSYRGGLAFPGEQLLRLSMDLATGTAGVLLALGAALSDRRACLPFLDSGGSRAHQLDDREGGETRGASGPSGHGGDAAASSGRWR